MSPLSRSDGSAQFSFGDLKALGAVTGPAEARIRDEKPTECTLEVNVVPVCGLPGPQTKALAHSIKLFFAPLILLKKYPRSLIQINLQTLSKPSDRWSHTFSAHSPSQLPVAAFDETQSVAEKAALINAASLALLDAGVCMRGCAFAIGVAIIPSSSAKSLYSNQALDSDQIVLDPNPIEEASAKSLHLVGYHFGHEFNSLPNSGGWSGKAALCESNGVFSYDQLQAIFKYASLATQQILAFARRSCESAYQHDEEHDISLSLLPPGEPSSTSHSNEKRKRKKAKKDK